jgi:hypothetical protein
MSPLKFVVGALLTCVLTSAEPLLAWEDVACSADDRRAIVSECIRADRAFVDAPRRTKAVNARRPNMQQRSHYAVAFLSL